MALTLRWFPQAFVQLRTDAVTIYIDPSLSSSLASMLRAAIPFGRRLPPAMPPGDLILATHDHPDHLDPLLVRSLAGDGAALVGPEACRKKMGDAMHHVRPGDRVTEGGTVVSVVHAYNPEGSRPKTYHPKGRGVGYVVEAGGVRVYHAGDTGLIEEMGDLRPLDIAFLPIGGRFTMDPEEAAEAAVSIGARAVVPIHQLRSDPGAFKRAVEGAGGPEVRVLAPGEPLTLG